MTQHAQKTPFIDPAYRSIVDRVAGFRAPEDVDEAVAVMRQMRGGPPTLDEAYPQASWTISEHDAGGSSSRAVRVLVAQPRPAVTEPTPVLVAVHGGGLISGTAEHGLREVAHLLDDTTPATVVSVDYGLAPETGFDVAVGDCVDAMRWLTRSGAGLGVDAKRVVVVGQSAGGALATSALLAVSVDVRGLMLSAPMLDDDSDSPSMRAFAGTGTWDRGWNRAGWAAARRDGSLTPAPARVEDLSTLRRVFLDVGSADSLLDEVTVFATRLWQAGSDTELHVWSGAHHGFDLSVPDADVSLQAQASRRQWLARTLHLDTVW